MHTQKTACQHIDQFGGKDLFFFKDNHPTAHEDLKLFFEDPEAEQSSWGFFSQTEKGHGRLTTRTVRTSTQMNDWFANEWTGIAQTFQVIRTVKRRCRKVLEQADQPTPASDQEPSPQSQAQETPPAKAKSRKKAKPSKQVTFVEETSQQVVYGFSNLTPAEAGPEAMALFLRKHWAIENRLRLLAGRDLA